MLVDTECTEHVTGICIHTFLTDSVDSEYGLETTEEVKTSIKLRFVEYLSFCYYAGPT